MFVNLTPHEITVISDNESVRIPSSGLARVEAKRIPDGSADGIPVSKVEFGSVIGLPDLVDGTFLIVSALVRAAVHGRPDVLSPGELVRDERGQPIGCRGLSR